LKKVGLPSFSTLVTEIGKKINKQTFHLNKNYELFSVGLMAKILAITVPLLLAVAFFNFSRTKVMASNVEGAQCSWSLVFSTHS
jgi:hypothetical protein